MGSYFNASISLCLDHVNAIPTTIRWSSPNESSSLEDLLRGFFQFYGNFNFQRDAISVYFGKRRDKITTDVVEVENPLDRWDLSGRLDRL